MSKENPVVRTISEIVEMTAALKGKALVCLYSADCKKLWDLSVPHLSEAETIVVVDTGPDKDLVSDPLGRQLSALDWANLYMAEHVQDVDNTAVYVVDLRKEAAADSFESDRSFFTDRVRYYAPYRSGRLESLDDFIHDLASTVGKRQRSPSKDIRRSAKKRWLSSLAVADTRSGHHQLNNALGPLMLALGNIGLQKILTTGPRGAARGLMLRALSWAMPQREQANTVKLEIPHKAGEFRLLLLDDQADEGWQQYFATLFGMSLSKEPRTNGVFTEYASTGVKPYKASLWVSTDAENVLEYLLEAGQKASQHWSTGLRLSRMPEDDYFSEVLFLDLRLFAVQGRKSEGEFHERVWDALSKSRDDLPNLKIETEWLARLSGLGQLLSYTDFTYPVVVWSSTGQRSVLEPFKKHANIRTGLEKPRLDPYFEGADDFNARLFEEVSDVIRWTEKRIAANEYFHRIFRVTDAVAFDISSLNGFQHAEVYIDESQEAGNTDNSRAPFKIGALVAFYPSKEAARDLHRQMESTVPRLVFFGRDEEKLPKKMLEDEVARAASALKKAIDAAGVKLVFVESFLDKQKDELGKYLQGDYPIDNRYPLLLEETLKVIFGLLLRRGTSSVYVATRQAVVPEKAQAEELFEKFGVLTSRVERKVKSRDGRFHTRKTLEFTSFTNHSAFHPVISAHAHMRGDASHSYTKLDAARGVTLAYNATPPTDAQYEFQLIYDLGKIGCFRHSGVEAAKLALKETRWPSFRAHTFHQDSWRHLHYFADSFMHKGNLQGFKKAGVVRSDGIFRVTFDSIDPSRDWGGLLCESIRARAWGDYRSAMAMLYKAQKCGANDHFVNAYKKKLVRELSGTSLLRRQRAKVAFDGLLEAMVDSA